MLPSQPIVQPVDEIQDYQHSYWQQLLHGGFPVLQLLLDHPRRSVPTFRGATHSFTLSFQLSEALQALSQAEETSLFTTLLAAFKLLLARYTGQDTIPVGTPSAAISADLSIAALLPVCTDLSGNPSFREAVRRVHTLVLGAFAHQELPFEQMTAVPQPSLDARPAPLFQAIFAFQDIPSDLARLRLGLPLIEHGSAGFDLALAMADTPAGLHGELTYNAELFDTTTISRMLGHFQTLLASIVAQPARPIGELALLSAAERQQLLVAWNATQAPFPDQTCIHHLFELQVAQTPDAIALVFGDHSLTYQELNRRANRLAHALRELGVGPEMLVGLCVERSLDLVIGLLGILKAGGAYLPLDPAYPQDRLAFMLQDAQVSIVLTQQALVDTLSAVLAVARQASAAFQPTVICLDTDWYATFALSLDNPAASAGPDNLAYVIYTSGSTGRPKGVMIAHRGLCNLAEAQIRSFDTQPDSRILQFASLCFDASIFEIVMALRVGAALHLAPRSALLGPEFAQLLREQAITTVTLPPSVLATLPNEPFPALRTIIVAGEACSAELVSRWSAGRRFFNAYGPTETTVWATVAECASGQRPPIGRPIMNAQIYLLDAQLQPVPVGVVGELYIGGAGVARGYLNRPELTNERFIANPFADLGAGVLEVEGGANIYKTGDLARYLPDGNIEYQGRIDQQLKIRGFRIEPGEIEAVLLQHPDVQDAIVIDQELPAAGSLEKRLVAYIIPTMAHQSPDAGIESSLVARLRRFVQDRLPQHMVPAVFMLLAALPLTPNGKVDRRALPAPAGVRPELEAAFLAPSTSAEQLLAQIWADALGLDQVGVHDNFFELGGDSILSIQIISRAHQAGLQISTRQLFQHPTVAELAALANSAPAASTPQGLVVGPVPLTPIQSWFFEQEFPNPHHWNQAMLLETPPDLNPALLEQVMAQILEHHDALRLCFECGEDGWRQLNAAGSAPSFFSWIDLSALAAAEQRPAIETAAAAVQASLDLAQSPRLRAALFDLGAGQPSRLLIVVNYLAIDGVSWRILLEDIQTAYQQLSQRQPLRLAPKTTAYQQWAQQLAEHARSNAIRQELDYWLDAIPASDAQLPLDYPGGANTMASAGTVTVLLTADETRALLQDVPKAYHTQINDVLLTALMQTFAWWTGARAQLITLESHGREEIFETIDLSRTVGWFTSIFPVLLRLSDGEQPEDALTETKELLRRIPQRGIGYGLLRYLSADPEIARQLRSLPKPDMRFNYLGQFDQVLSGSSLFRRARESYGPTRDLHGKRTHILVAEGLVTEGQLRFEWTYSANLHRRSTIEGIASHYLAALRALITHCLSPEAGGFTASDFPLAHLDNQEFDKLARLLGRLEDVST